MCCCEFLSYVDVQETFCPFEVKFSAAAMFRCTSAALSRVQTPCLLANLLLFHGHQISCSHFKVSHDCCGGALQKICHKSSVLVCHCKRSSAQFVTFQSPSGKGSSVSVCSVPPPLQYTNDHHPSPHRFLQSLHHPDSRFSRAQTQTCGLQP